MEKKNQAIQPDTSVLDLPNESDIRDALSKIVNDYDDMKLPRNGILLMAFLNEGGLLADIPEDVFGRTVSICTVSDVKLLTPRQKAHGNSIMEQARERLFGLLVSVGGTFSALANIDREERRNMN